MEQILNNLPTQVIRYRSASLLLVGVNCVVDELGDVILVVSCLDPKIRFHLKLMFNISIASARNENFKLRQVLDKAVEGCDQFQPGLFMTFVQSIDDQRCPGIRSHQLRQHAFRFLVCQMSRGESRALLPFIHLHHGISDGVLVLRDCQLFDKAAEDIFRVAA